MNPLVTATLLASSVSDISDPTPNLEPVKRDHRIDDALLEMRNAREGKDGWNAERLDSAERLARVAFDDAKARTSSRRKAGEVLDSITRIRRAVARRERRQARNLRTV